MPVLGLEAEHVCALDEPPHRGEKALAPAAVDAPDRADAGVVAFKLVGRNQDGKVVLEIDREVLIKRKSHYLMS